MDREKVMRGLECCCTHIVGMSCGNCPYEIEQREYEGISDCTSVLAYDALALLKEQEAVVKQWTKEIADNQLAHAPDELDRENWDYKKGIWDGLQIAWNIISEGR